MLATAVINPQKVECSFTINGIKYDVSKWLPYHPGGDEILRKYDGLDATDVFNAFHSPEAHKKLKDLKGVPDTTESKDPQANHQKYEELTARLKAAGLLDRSPYYYFYKTTTTLGLFFLSILLLWNGNWLLSSIALGLFWQQAGWLSHEYCHHCVFNDRKLNTSFGLVLGNLLQGYSISWWKDRHNTHHAITNVLEADPDIDNLPVFMWTTHDFHRLATWNSKLTNILGATLPYQAFYFLPFCALLKLIWCLQSVLFALSMKHSISKSYRSRANIELGLLAAHWIGYATFFFFLPSVSSMFYYFFISEGIGGFCIAVIVFFNHYACEQFPNTEKTQMSFLELQLRTTRNASPGVLIDWFAGGLNYQVEHHLYPTMPRNNLYPASKIVRQFCKENNLPYQCMDFFDGLVLLHKHLHEIGQAVPKYIQKVKSS